MTAGTPPAQPASHPPRRVSVYIDGFNFYYGSLKGTPYKWLDPYSLACALMPSDDVTAVHYFTARVKPTPRNPSVHQRQGIICAPSRRCPTSTSARGSSSSRPPGNRRCSRSTRRTPRYRTRLIQRLRSG